MGASNYCHLEDCDIVKETDAAFLVRWEGTQYWFPKSQIADGDKNLAEGDGKVTVSVTEWVCRQKNIEVED